MPAGKAHIKGGLPVWIVVSTSRDWETGEYDESVDEIYWLKKDGTPGKHISEKLWDEAEAADSYFCNMLEYFWDGVRFDQEVAEGKIRPDGMPIHCVCNDEAAIAACQSACMYTPFEEKEPA